MSSASPETAATRRFRHLRRAGLGIGALLAAIAAVYAPSTLRAAAVLGAAVDMYDPSGLTTLVSYDVRSDDYGLQLPDRSLRSRRYVPAGVTRPPVALLLHGVHPRGIDEPRLRAFAHALSSVGIEVHTPELPELVAFRAEPRLIADIAHCAVALQRASGGRRVGAFGISFAGGLLLAAATSPEGSAALDYVVALGAHHDMRRLARYYAGAAVSGPDGARQPPSPHPYGGRILASLYAADLFGDEAETAREALTLHLTERYRESTQVRAKLSPEAQTRLDAVLVQPSPELQPLLLSAAQRHAPAFADLSPAGHLANLRMPVFLLHGQDDPVVPSTETEWLAREVPERALRGVLITPALRHAEGAGVSAARDAAQLLGFLSAVLREAGD